MIDVLLRFTSETAAKNALARFMNMDEDQVARWNLAEVMPGVKVWRPSQDTAEGAHTYLTGYYILAAADREKLPQAVLDLSQVQFAYDREELAARKPGAILKSTVGAAVLRDVQFEPVFMGADIPWGELDKYL